MLLRRAASHSCCPCASLAEAPLDECTVLSATARARARACVGLGPTHPHQKNFSHGKLEFIKGGGDLRSILGTETFFWPLSPPPPRFPVRGSRVFCPVMACYQSTAKRGGGHVHGGGHIWRAATWSLLARVRMPMRGHMGHTAATTKSTK